MKLKKFKRLISCLLCAVIALTIVPNFVLAAGGPIYPLKPDQSDHNIKVTATGAGTMTWEQIEGDYYKILAGVGRGSMVPATQNITIENNSEYTAVISFTYDVEIVTKGYVKIDGETIEDTCSGLSFESAQLAPGGKINIVMYRDFEIGMNPNCLIMRDFTFLPVGAGLNVNFEPVPADKGTATANGIDLVNGATIKATHDEGIDVSVTPAAQYDCAAWADENGELLLSGASGIIRPTRDNMTVHPVFTPKGGALFGVDKKIYTDLNEAAADAINAPVSLVYLAKSGTLPAGEYIIDGVTLLIPRDEENTESTVDQLGLESSAGAPHPFRTLTLASGAHINVTGGRIDVAGRYVAGSGGNPVKTTGPYGRIELSAGSSITISDYSELLAYGYITGEGNIHAGENSQIHEVFQITDFRGGNATKDCNKNGHFPLSQYYVQNIEARITYEQTASEYLHASFKMSVVGNVGVHPRFIGKGGLFVLAEGSTLTKWYDPQADKLMVELNGDASLEKISLDILGTVNLNSANYNLPINNIQFRIKDGSMLKINHPIELLPDSGIIVDPGGTL